MYIVNSSGTPSFQECIWTKIILILLKLLKIKAYLQSQQIDTKGNENWPSSNFINNENENIL